MHSVGCSSLLPGAKAAPWGLTSEPGQKPLLSSMCTADVNGTCAPSTISLIALAFPAEISEELFHQGLGSSLYSSEVSCCFAPISGVLLQIMANLLVLLSTWQLFGVWKMHM